MGGQMVYPTNLTSSPEILYNIESIRKKYTIAGLKKSSKIKKEDWAATFWPLSTGRI